MAVQDYRKRSVYGMKDVTLLDSAAGQIAIAIERKRADEKLRESEEKYRTADRNGDRGDTASRKMASSSSPTARCPTLWVCRP